ncbi:LacI family DNA-binding transcriptional regulator [Paenibacillus sp. GCM10012303]|uniref:LacI family DNA-binding transcriptional regulator n=1 Tax=Paenibacillus sp. GCM10012303 TaxID=3317340 RepID=UPI003620939E
MSVTKKQIADHLGISRTAVSLVLNNSPSSSISQETRDRILQAAKDLGYKDTTPRHRLCLLLINMEIDDPRFMSRLDVISRAADRMQCDLIFKYIPQTNDSIAQLTHFLHTTDLAGIIVRGPYTSETIQALEQVAVPYLVQSFEEHAPSPSSNMRQIVYDQSQVAYLATKRLIDLGHRHIALFLGRIDLQVHIVTLRGYRQALIDHGITPDMSLVQSCKEEDGYELCRRLRIYEVPYTAILCCNTIVEFAALQWHKDHHVAVPEQVSLLGFGATSLITASTPVLSSVRIDSEEMMLAMMKQIEGLLTEDQATTLYVDKVEFLGKETLYQTKQ